MLRSFFGCCIIAASVVGCASAPPIAPIGGGSLLDAQKAIRISKGRERAQLGESEALGRVSRAAYKLANAAKEVCLLDDKRPKRICKQGWETEVFDGEDFNAFAYDSNKIGVNLGLLRVTNDDELSFVIAHEMAHHIANHINEDKRNAYIGEFLGTVVGAAAYSAIASGLGAECNSAYQDCGYLEDFIKEGADAGREVGGGIALARYSRQQEVEADKLAVEIMNNAGVALDSVPSLLAYMGSLGSDGLNSKFGDSHPSGPERLAYFSTEFTDRSAVKERVAGTAIDGEVYEDRIQINGKTAIFDPSLGVYFYERPVHLGRNYTGSQYFKYGWEIAKNTPLNSGKGYKIFEGDVIEAQSLGFFRTTTQWLAKYGEPRPVIEDLLRETKQSIGKKGAMYKLQRPGQGSVQTCGGWCCDGRCPITEGVVKGLFE